MQAEVTKRYSAVLAMDVAGYTRLMELDEAGTFARVRALMEDVVAPTIAETGGHIVKYTGDGALVEWSTVPAAVHAALQIQARNEATEQAVRSDRRARMRMGLNACDVIATGDDIFGEGVNLAARLEGIAGVGEVYVSAAVAEGAAGSCTFVDLGERRLKNVARPVRVFRAARAADERAGSGILPGAPGLHIAGFGDRPAIAVLPFKENGGDQGHFAVGVTEGMITALARWNSYPVISRNSVFSLGGTDLDLRLVGQQLGVRYVVEGSLQRTGGRLRTVVALIDVDTDATLLSETYDSDASDVLMVQDEIVRALVGRLEPALLRRERDRVATAQPINPTTYEMVQLGLWHHYKYDRAHNKTAQEVLDQALSLEPGNVQGMVTLALTIMHAANLGWSDDREGSQNRAMALARQAVAAAPDDPSTNFALGTMCQNMARPEEAARHLQEAIRLNPSHAFAHANLGYVYCFMDRPDEALPEFELAFRLSPGDPRRFIWSPGLAASHYLAGRHRAALVAAHEALQLNSRHPVALRYLVASLGVMGRAAEARPALAMLATIDGNLAGSAAHLYRSYNKAAATKLLDGLQRAGFA